MIPRTISVLSIAALLLAPDLRAQPEREAAFDPPHSSLLGVTVEDTDQGLRVDSVQPGGAADRAGMVEGDVLLSVGDWKWRPGGRELAEHLAGVAPGDFQAQVQRDGANVELRIETEPRLVATAREVARRINRNGLFRRAAKVDLKPLADQLSAAVRATESREAAYAAINDLIDRCDLSHTAVMTPWVVENLFGSGQKFHLGMFVQAHEVDGERRYFVRSLMYGSPARDAGLRIGDEIVEVNGTRYARSPRKTLAGFEARRQMSTVQVDRDETVTLRYRRRLGGGVEELQVTADKPLDAVGSTKRSVRLIGGGGDPAIGYIHFWNVMSEDNITVLEEALRGPLENAEALAIDLRGRGGQVGVINAIARMLAREKRPIALLIDREARSAKEMLAHRLKGRRHITLIGETTAGAVLPAGFHDLPCGAKLMLPVPIGDAGIRFFTRGDRLEGVGAMPDVKVDAPLPYRAGEDPILARAESLLLKQARGELSRL